jgi:hypothetical protein
MANEIYDSTWWGNTIQTTSSIGTSTEMIQGQFNLTKLGDEEVTNGDFATDSDWTLGNGSYISQGSLILPNTGTAIQTGIPTNKMVRLDVQGSGNITYRLSTGVSFQQISLPQTIYLTTGSSGGRVQFSNTSGSEVKIDNVSVKEARAEEVEAKKCLADAIHRIGIQDIQN